MHYLMQRESAAFKGNLTSKAQATTCLIDHPYPKGFGGIPSQYRGGFK